MQTPDEIDLLAPEPAVLTGALIGYARVSRPSQVLDRQVRALEAVGCLRVFNEKKTGRTAQREQFDAALDYLRPGDTLVVLSLDRLSRSLQDLITLVADLRRRGVGFKSLHEALDTTTPADGSCSMSSSRPWPSSSVSSSSKAPMKAWTPPAPAACASGGPRR